MNKEGELALNFDREIKVSNFLANLSSENEGAKYIAIEYKMSETTKNSISDLAFEQQTIGWYISDLLPNSV